MKRFDIGVKRFIRYANPMTAVVCYVNDKNKERQLAKKRASQNPGLPPVVYATKSGIKMVKVKYN